MNITEKEFENELDLIFSEMKQMLIEKNKSYGNSAFKGDFKFAIIGNMFRLGDKQSRYENLIKKLINNEEPSYFGESIEYTLKDIIGYSAIGLMIAKKR